MLVAVEEQLCELLRSFYHWHLQCQSCDQIQFGLAAS